jgi:hypothetical protein
MAQSTQSWGIPTQLSLPQFQQFVLPHLTVGRRGPAPKLSLHAVFNYILKLRYIGCQWKELPIAKDAVGRPEIHYTRIYGAFRRWRGVAIRTSDANNGRVPAKLRRSRWDRGDACAGDQPLRLAAIPIYRIGQDTPAARDHSRRR